MENKKRKKESLKNKIKRKELKVTKNYYEELKCYEGYHVSADRITDYRNFNPSFDKIPKISRFLYEGKRELKYKKNVCCNVYFPTISYINKFSDRGMFASDNLELVSCDELAIFLNASFDYVYEIIMNNNGFIVDDRSIYFESRQDLKQFAKDLNHLYVAKRLIAN